jgi:tungstate transport system ATP-binding protein
MSTVLEIHDLLVRLDKKIILEIDSLTVQNGEILAIVGPNGSGKSTLLLAVARLIKMERGVISFDGSHVSGESDTKYRRHMGLVLQESLLLDTSVFDNVAVGLRFRKVPANEVKQRVETWLKRFGIEHLHNRPAVKLSGGEAQRVSLARAFSLEPELLLLDEPFSALDAPSRKILLEDLKEILAETSTTTIFITHDLKEATSLGDKLAVILRGKLMQYGTPEEIYANPKNDEVRSFLGLNS